MRQGGSLSRGPAITPTTRPAESSATDRPLLVALHGWLLSSRLWQPLALELETAGWSLWCPDLPGFGQRPRPRGMPVNLAEYGRWLAQAVIAEAGERPVVLLGHSLGGSIALHAAPHLQGQLRGLVQVAAGGGVYQPRPFARLRRGGAAFLQWRPGWLARLPGTDAIRSPLIAELRAARGLLACSTNRGAVRQLPALVHGLSVPNLWIAGGRDTVMEARYVRHLAGYSPLHQLQILPEAGHLPMRQMPRQLAALLLNWLEEEGLERCSGGAQSVASPFSCNSASWA